MAILSNGFNTTITFPQAGILFIEQEVKPPGLDGNGPIDITAMRNIRWRTFLPKYLITMTMMSLKARWDPMMYVTIVANLNVNQVVLVNFPTLTNTPARVLNFYAWLNKFDPEPMKVDEDPLADMEIHPSNNNGGIEAGPTMS